MAKGIAIRREQQSLWLEKQRYARNTTSGPWPTLDTKSSTTMEVDSPATNLLYSSPCLEVWQQDYLARLPTNCRVCSLSIDETTNELFIGCYAAPSTQLPILTLRLPLQRKAARDGDDMALIAQEGSAAATRDTLTYAEATQLFHTIMKESHASMESIASFKKSNPEAKCTPPELRKSWWTQRCAIDRRLAHLLQRIECDWLGGFKVTSTVIQLYLSAHASV
jgi:hypothetical protein